MSIFFETLCPFLGVEHLKTTAYHLQIIGHAERYNKSIIARFHHYVAEHQHDLDLFEQPMT